MDKEDSVLEFWMNAVVVLGISILGLAGIARVSNATGFLVGANLRIFRATKINCAQFRIFRIFRITTFAPKCAQ